ncbi:molybdenum cofactor guanylyltransferase [Devosia nitrariae]|uniref:Molybdenum cofactor guanylyltransferase n=1 Tax=Devosia nitrariae TaxID=2071872 RepID=A0ABQ5WD72_9HYPH|nr:molybdenum cofactor guanylyltransferase [Devosia nitrariae]GLQ57912.1 molybdenum cofactor guanylyltransferase [Devosia nitrariae]
MTRIAAVVLAGGRGERLGGVRKAGLKLWGRRLIDRTLANLSRHCAPVLVSTGRIDPALLQLPDDVVAIADLDLPIAGPLAGLLAAADWMGKEATAPDLLVSIAVDTPFVPDDFVPRLAAELPEGALAACATCGPAFYPTNAVWRRESLARLSARIGEQTLPRSLRAFLEEIGAHAVDWRPDADGDPFSNINTLANLIALSRRRASDD